MERVQIYFDVHAWYKFCGGGSGVVWCGMVWCVCGVCVCVCVCLCNGGEEKEELLTIVPFFPVIKQVAKDWVSGNWYFADDVREQIFVCTSDGEYCMAVIHTDLSRPKSLALDPTKG